MGCKVQKRLRLRGRGQGARSKSKRSGDPAKCEAFVAGGGREEERKGAKEEGSKGAREQGKEGQRAKEAGMCLPLAPESIEAF